MIDQPGGSTFRVIDSCDIEPVFGVMRRIRQTAGITAFGINEYDMPPGWDDYDEHDETTTGHQEMYLCLSGGGTMTIDGSAVTLAPDRYVFVEPDSTRNVVAGPDGLRMIVVGAPARPEHTGWKGL